MTPGKTRADGAQRAAPEGRGDRIIGGQSQRTGVPKPRKRGQVSAIVERPARWTLAFRRISADWGGWWEVRVGGTRIETQGRTLAQARRHARLMLVQEHGPAAECAKLAETVHVPAAAQEALDAARAARAALEQAAAAERAATAAAVRTLVSRGFSVRDTGELLGLSGARVQQIHAAELRP